MAVVSSPESSRLRLMLLAGTDEDGKPIVVTRNYSRIKTDADDEEVYQVAAVLEGLQKYSQLAVKRVTEVKLEDL